MSSSSPSSLNDDEERSLITYEDDLEKMIGENVIDGQDRYAQKLFLVFQNAAKEVTKMFRERSNGNNSWNNFHAAAEAVTMLYKESLDALKDTIELGIINGEQRKTKELLCWTRRKHHRYVMTDEVYHQLMGCSKSESTSESLVISDDDIHSGASSNNENLSNPIVEDLQTFRQALIMDGNSPSDSNLSTDCQTCQQLDNFVCQQMTHQLARKRPFHSEDFSSNVNTSDAQKTKRNRHM